jgi:hypothetical protein
MRVPKIMKTWHIGQIRGFAGWAPDHAPEPVAPDVPIVIRRAPQPGGGAVGGSPLGPVVGERAPAMRAQALSSVVGAERPMPILSASLVGLGEPQGAWLGDRAKRDRRNCPPREQEGIRAEAAGGDVGLELDEDLHAELEPPAILVLGVMLDEEPLAVGVEPSSPRSSSMRSTGRCRTPMPSSWWKLPQFVMMPLISHRLSPQGRRPGQRHARGAPREGPPDAGPGR